MAPQLLDPHKFDVTDKTPSTGTDAELRGVVIDMLKQGHSDDEVRKFIQKVDDLKSPGAARMAGAMAGIGPGLLTGLIGVPLMVKDAVLDGISMLQGRDPENAKAFVDSVKTFLPKLQAAGPREQAQMVSELATSFGTGAAMSGGAFAARKPIAQAAGTGLMKAVEHPAGVRLTSGSAMLGGVYTGNPGMVAAGAVGAALPDVAEGAGRALYKYGAGKEYISPTQAKTISKLEDKFKDAMSTRNGTFADEQTVAAAKAGLEPGVPNVRTSISAKDPNGGRTSVSQSFKAPGTDKTPVPAGLTAAEAAEYRAIKSAPNGAQIPDDVILAGIRGTKVNPIANVTPAGRPAIRVTGSSVDPRDAGVKFSSKAEMDAAGPALAPDVQARLTDAAPVERRVSAGQAPGGTERRAAVTSDELPATGSIAERAAALRKENPAIDQEAATMRAQAAESRRGGTAVLEAPPVEAPVVEAPAAGVPDNYMTDTDVANIGEHASEMGNKTLQTLRDAGADVPEGGLQSTHDIDRVVATTPKNLHMGSDASPKEIAADVRVRAQGGGGIRVTGSRPNEPISLVKGEPLPLNEEAQKVLKQYIAENPEVDPAVAEAHLRKLMGSEE